MAVSQTLSVTEVSGSVNTSANTSKVRILWKSTQSGNSWNGYTRTAKYYISINGGAETEYTVNYTLPQASTVTILDTTITVTHKGDGSGSVRVRTWMDTSISAGVVEKSQSINLTTIPRASSITSALDRALGSACSVMWTPLSKSFRYKLKFSIGNWEYTTLPIHPNTTSPYTYTEYILSLDAANQIPKTTGTMTVSLFTFSDSNATVQVGSSSPTTFTVTVPNNEDTKPSISMPLTNVISLGSPYSSLYIQGKSRVETALSGEGRYGATIASKEFYVDGKNNGTFVSDYLSKSGKITVKGIVRDSRGYSNEKTEEITVIPYSKPALLPASGESSIICARCDADGNLTESGTYLKIKARRQYSSVQSHNKCQLRYRYKVEGGTYSGWNTILDYSATSDEVITNALLGGALSVQKTYYVELQAIDDLGEAFTTTITIPTDKVYRHKAASMNSYGIGKYAEEENVVDIAEDLEVIVRGGFRAKEVPPGTDLNTLLKPNNYFGNQVSTSGYVNCPMNPAERSTFALEVISLGGGGQILQRLTVCSPLATVYEREYYGGKWVVPWECVNPPLYKGVEYRTKERYDGKVVHTKLVDLGNLPNATRKQVAHGASATKIIRCCGQMSNGVSLPFHYDNTTNWIEIYAGGSDIVVLTGNDQSSRTATAQIWYLKD